MKVNRILLLTISFICLAAISVYARSTSEIYKEAKKSIVLLVAYDSSNIPLSLGSGFFIDAHHIATNYHVVNGASRVIYQVIDSKKLYEVKNISTYSERLDLAVLEVQESHTPLKIRKGLYAEIGKKVIAIGNPKGLTGSVSEGIISGIRSHNEFTFLQITAPISPGSSGGPLFNELGEVIGVTTLTLSDSQNLNFAVASFLINRLKSKGKNWEPTIPSQLLKPKKGNTGVTLVEPRFTNISGGEFVWSIANNTKNRIKDIAYVLIFRNARTGAVLHYETYKEREALLPGLSKRNTAWLRTLKSYQVVGESIYPYSEIGMYGYVDVELRVLSYDIIEDKTGLDVLDLIQK
ncbi:MAG: S1C family serine protease [Thermodesulfobacteriota bacterium]|nr:S1C family serine protease [Thermodesulfobacteriota bacterium]